MDTSWIPLQQHQWTIPPQAWQHHEISMQMQMMGQDVPGWLPIRSLSLAQIAYCQYVAVCALTLYNLSDAWKVLRNKQRYKSTWTANAWSSVVVEVAILALWSTLLATLIRQNDILSIHAIGFVVCSLVASVNVIATFFLSSTNTIRGMYHLAAIPITHLFCLNFHHSSIATKVSATYSSGVFFIAFCLDLAAPFTQQTAEFPFEKVSWLQSLTVTWIAPLINLAGKDELTLGKLWKVNESTSVQAILDALLKGAFKNKDAASSLLPFLYQGNRLALSTSGVCELINTLSRLIQPYLLQEYLRQPSMAYVGYMFLLRVVAAVCTSRVYFITSFMSARLKAGMTSMIYEKTLDTPAASRPAGMVPATLAEVDTQRVIEFIPLIHNFWSVPLLIIVSLLCITRSVGLIGVILASLLMVVTYPITHMITVSFHRGIGRLMQSKDSRIRLTTEVMEKLTPIKLYGYESVFQKKLDMARVHELDVTQSLASKQASLFGLLGAIPDTMTAIAFLTVYYLNKSSLSADMIFPTLGYFIILKMALATASGITQQVTAALTSFRRIDDYVKSKSESLLLSHCAPTKTNFPLVLTRQADFGWPGKSALVSGLDLDISSPTIISITGTSSSGKTTLLHGLLGLDKPISGDVLVRGSIAYAPQAPWLINGTIRDNILFFRPFKPQFYETVLRACALDSDMARFPNGDLTDLAGVGSTLSGGQRSRISMARALYSEANIVCLDDPLAAVDARVKSHIVQSVFGPGGVLSRSICLVATNCEPVMQAADRQLIIKDGHITMIDSQGQQQASMDPNSLTGEDKDRITFSTVGQGGITDAEPSDDGESDAITIDTTTARGSSNDIEANAEITKSPLSIVSPPATDWHALAVWLGMAKPIGWIIVVLLVALTKVSSGLSTYALKKLSTDSAESGIAALLDLGFFTIIGLVQAASTGIFLIVTYHFCLLPASRQIHLKLINALIHSSSSLFTTTTLGEVLGLFTNDLSVIDGTLASNFLGMMMMGSNLVLTLVMLIIPSPGMLVFLVPLMLLYGRLQSQYLQAACQLRRLDLSSRNPIINGVQEASSGNQIIQIHGRRNHFLRRHYDRVNDNLSIRISALSLDTWLLIRLDIIGSLVQVLTATALIWFRVDAAQGGFVMNYAMQVTSILQPLVRYRTSMGLDLISINRIESCCKIAEASVSRVTMTEAPDAWPNRGEISFKSLSASYHGANRACLDNVDFTLSPGQSVAVVGRTGSGKSSLALALLGMIGVTQGQIEIDGLDISLLTPEFLRSKIAVVPQSPPIFVGSLRENIDPEGNCDDDKIRKAIGRSGLGRILQFEGDILDLEVSGNLSGGQIQLIAIIRALTLGRKILVMDEATAGLDQESEAAVQRLLQTDFRDCTVITITHSLKHLRDYDRVLVLSDGRVKGFGSPNDLLQDPESSLSHLMHSKHNK